MDIGIIDASHYFKGLLLLIRKDHKVTQPEIDLMRSIGKSLGFEPEFCSIAILDILDNPYIEDVPPSFSSMELAMKFIRDGLYLAFVDHDEIHPDEKEWLKVASEINGIEMEIFLQEMEHARTGRGKPYRLEVFDLTVKYF